jgi:peptidoglycan/LPS O-acetylase OafA/YrhL
LALTHVIAEPRTARLSRNNDALFNSNVIDTVRRPALGALTGLRFVAALGVVLFHAVPPRFPSARGPLIQLVKSGYVGVSLFFVLSGFILAYNYLNPRGGGIRSSTRDFWWARFARIYPVYLFALAFSSPQIVNALRYPSSQPDYHQRLGALILDPILLQGWLPTTACKWNCPGWSLSVEAFFYVLFPFFGIWLARKHSRSIAAIVAAAWGAEILLPALYRTLTPDGTLDPARLANSPWLAALRFNPIPHLPEFLLGVAAGIIFLRSIPPNAADRTQARTQVTLRVMSGLAVAMTLLVLALTHWLPFLFLHTGLLAPIWVLAIFSLASDHGSIARLLGSRPAIHLGEASYALYLIHSPLNAYLDELTDRGLLPQLSAGWSLLSYLALALLLSLAIFYWIERPARKFIRKRARAASSPVAPSLA